MVTWSHLTSSTTASPPSQVRASWSRSRSVDSARGSDPMARLRVRDPRLPKAYGTEPLGLPTIHACSKSLINGEFLKTFARAHDAAYMRAWPPWPLAAAVRGLRGCPGTRPHRMGLSETVPYKSLNSYTADPYIYRIRIDKLMGPGIRSRTCRCGHVT